ncbi:sugar ABC transporter permease [Paenibacillus alginolyticus]|uniref:Sugar ABC transporter permease n=1 Tax=Paenibacillus alginolyticus TaxID=59839 RepID=A0ABT4GBQ2_9BACL|nr:sugar ABC transporter permease [Paenibacillus alginolyticus]MCY9666189.1 sugar ABC transporter permease [Paenibacillus alginolyticus]MCY9693617.1 sugar ABC transporter permease [Paenibacillus alginolyticus]MEC0142348.1 sugar ABC transporter permease [Paenibacillus alginolyticus]
MDTAIQTAVETKIKSRSFRMHEQATAFWFIFPAIALLLVFVFYPMLQAFIISFKNYSLVGAGDVFVGMDNYVHLMKDRAFFNSLKHSFYFAIIVIPIQTSIALGLALLIQKKTAAAGLFRTLYFIPVIISTAVAATVFKLIYNKEFGLLNSVLKALHLPVTSFLSDPDTAMNGIIVLGIWKGAGFFMIIFLAGLNNISPDLYEAARVDGASRIQQFFKITLPLLNRTMAFVVIMTTIDAIKLSGLVFVLTNGGPNSSTETVVFYIYKQAFTQMRMGYATAAAFVLFAIVLAISLIQMKLFNKDTD